MSLERKRCPGAESTSFPHRQIRDLVCCEFVISIVVVRALREDVVSLAVTLALCLPADCSKVVTFVAMENDNSSPTFSSWKTTVIRSSQTKAVLEIV